MGTSWSNMRKILEQDNICESLKGRIQYFATRYKKSHDEEGRVAIRVDGQEIIKSCFYIWENIRYQVVDEMPELRTESNSYTEYWDKVHAETENRGGIELHSFYQAFHIYPNASISPNPIVKLFAIFDKRSVKERSKEFFQILSCSLTGYSHFISLGFKRKVWNHR